MTDDFILLPRRGLGARDAATANFLAGLPRAASTGPSAQASLAAQGGGAVEIVDTAQETGPKLVRMSAEDAEAINVSSTMVRALPVVTYGLPDPIPYQPTPPVGAGVLAPPTAAAITTFTVLCRETGTATPLADCTVVAFDNFALRSGVQGVTDAAGRVTLGLPGATIDRLYIYSAETHWGAFRRQVPIAPNQTITIDIDKVQLTFVDAVRHYYGASQFQSGTGVTVGVIDTGVGPHANLNIVSGTNTVTGEPATDFGDWFGHGTHVAGLIGSNGAPPTGLRGVAPGVQIRAYRVFGLNAKGCTNYAILKALIRAAAEGCDIVNLSLGGGPHDPIVEEAIADARNQGMLVVIAAGNDGRKPVSYPGAYAGATAVSAMGRAGTFPAGSVAEGDVQRPPSSSADPAEFIAGFSNIGAEIAVTAPGVGVLSTLPDKPPAMNRHGPMSGTSMAAPVAAGAAASLLSQNAATFGMTRNAARATAIEKLLQLSAVRRNFGPNYEGFGLPENV